MIFEVLAFFFFSWCTFLLIYFVSVFDICEKEFLYFFLFISVFITTKEFKNRSFVKKNFKTCFVVLFQSLSLSLIMLDVTLLIGEECILLGTEAKGVRGGKQLCEM